MPEISLAQGTIRYRDTGPRDAPVVVFVHGLLVSGTLWRKVVPALEGELRCIVPDLPLGAHEVPLAAGAERTPRGIAHLLADLLAALDLDDVTLVANDTGGAITQLLMVERPERVGRVVLTPCDCFDNFLPPMFRPMQAAARVPGALLLAMQPMRSPRMQRLPMAFGLLTKRPIDPAVTAAWLDAFLADSAVRADVTAFLRAIDKRTLLDASARLTEFHKPVLLAWASEDRVFPPEHARRLAAILPDARVEEIADSYSFVPEDQPERLAALIQAFAGSSAGSIEPSGRSPATSG